MQEGAPAAMRQDVRSRGTISAVLALGLLASACSSGAAPAQPTAPPPVTSAPPAAGASTAVGPTTAGGSTARPTTIDELATYKGADRQQILEEGAKKEGKLVWYTTLIVNQAVRPLVDAFKAKYPYVDVETWRGNSSDVAQRVIQEYGANRYDVDLADGTNTPAFMRAQGISRAFFSPSLATYTDNVKDKDGYWAATNVYFMTEGYNTQLVPKGTQPKTLDDLLDPKWKGQMAWSTSSGSGGPGFVGDVLDVMGKDKGMEYLTRLSKQDIHNVDSAARAVLDQVIAGEFPIALQIFNHHAVISAQQGAPVDWQPLEPVLGQIQGIALAKSSPHPHAALLFLDFILAPDGGQQIMRNVDYLPAAPSVQAKVPTLKPDQGNFKVNFTTPEHAFEKDREWNDVYQKLFVH